MTGLLGDDNQYTVSIIFRSVLRMHIASDKRCRENQNTRFMNLMFIGPCIILIVE